MPSLPSPGAWIEIVNRLYQAPGIIVAPLHRERGLKFCQYVQNSYPVRRSPSPGAWIEMNPTRKEVTPHESLPSPGAWIEIRLTWLTAPAAIVAPFTGSVD